MRKNSTTRAGGLAVAFALSTTVIGFAPAHAAPATPVPMGTFTDIAAAEDKGAIDLGSTILFAAGTEAKGVELWRTGFGQPTQQLLDINPGPDSSQPGQLTQLNGWTMFVAKHATDGRELYRTDGTANGTQYVKDIVDGPGSATISGLTTVGDTMVFAATVPGEGGRELWVTDGTKAGTQRLKDINPGAGNSDPAGMVTVGNQVYFAADDGAHGKELWKTDGTAAGTVMVEDIRAGADSSSPADLTSLDDEVVFSASSLTGREPWVSGGDAASTKQLTDVLPGVASSFPDELTRVGQSVVFRAQGPQGNELWRTSGFGSTNLVKDIRPGQSSSSPGNFTAVGSAIYFDADDGEHGSELWRSNLTDAGTHLMADIRPGAAGSNPQHMVNSGGRVLMSANDGQHGEELWVSNGSTEGTALVADQAPGAASSTPVPLGTILTSVVYRTSPADQPSQLWSIDTAKLGPIQSGTPSIVGSPVVGQSVSASPGAWEAGATLSYQWLVNGTPVGDGPTYAPTAGTVGGSLVVRVTGTSDGKITTHRDSAASTIVAAPVPAPGKLSKTPAPSIKGVAKVGKTLKVVKRTYDSGTTKRYQWLRNGKVIKGSAAKKSTYKLRSADRGKRIQVKVTVTKPGYASVVKVSGKTSKVKAKKSSSNKK
jgi:ELWxxDGT repeat protein